MDVLLLHDNIVSMQSLKCEIVLDEDILRQFDFNMEYGFDQLIPPVYVQRLATKVHAFSKTSWRERTTPIYIGG